LVRKEGAKVHQEGVWEAAEGNVAAGLENGRGSGFQTGGAAKKKNQKKKTRHPLRPRITESKGHQASRNDPWGKEKPRGGTGYGQCDLGHWKRREVLS